MLDDGFAGMDGHLAIPVDDFGCYGRLFPMSVFDWFQPAGVTADYPTYIAGAFLFVTTGAQTSKVLLSDQTQWTGFLEGPPQEDGLAGDHANLARTITTNISGSGTTATSGFDVTATGFAIHVGLTQTITTDLTNATSQLAQIYQFRNDGNTSVDLVFHAAWEPDLYFDNNIYEDDVSGVVPGLCAVYVHDPNSSTISVLLASGPGTTVTQSPYYYAGKRKDVPPNGTTEIVPLSAADADQHIWLGNGMPTSWRNYATGAGYNTPGDSGTLLEDATIGMEWHFTVAAGATETIDVRRIYGTIAHPCNVPTTCGNGAVDPGELCDGANTPTCNGGTCLAAACGDGYDNPLAEECETGGVDSETCNGMSCTTPACGDEYVNAAAGEMCDDGEETASCTAMCQPSSCGDGYINLAADEECDGGALCDPATCVATFTVGGGCAGCGTSDARTWWPLALALVLLRRRRQSRSVGKPRLDQSL